MPTAIIDGLEVNYEKRGSGPALLMFAPGGFDATMDKWLSASAWKEINALDALAEEHTLILYDRRECGQSGGRVERLSWASYTKQGKGLLDYLKIDSAFVLGACMGCSVAVALPIIIRRGPRGVCSCIGRWAAIAGKFPGWTVFCATLISLNKTSSKESLNGREDRKKFLVRSRSRSLGFGHGARSTIR